MRIRLRTEVTHRVLNRARVRVMVRIRGRGMQSPSIEVLRMPKRVRGPCKLKKQG